MSDELKAKLTDWTPLATIAALIMVAITLATFLWYLSDWHSTNQERGTEMERRVMALEQHSAARDAQSSERYVDLTTKLALIQERQSQGVDAIHGLQDDVRTILRQVGGQSAGRVQRETR